MFFSLIFILLFDCFDYFHATPENAHQENDKQKYFFNFVFLIIVYNLSWKPIGLISIYTMYHEDHDLLWEINRFMIATLLKALLFDI